MMTDTKKTSRTGRENKAKKIISVTIDPALIHQIDTYAADRGISRSAAIETVLTGFFATKSTPAFTMPDKSLVQPDNCLFASSQLGAAIHY